MTYYETAKIKNGIYVKVEIREQSGWPIRYAAQISCPEEKCEAFYNAEWRSTPNTAKNDVVHSLRKHYKKKH